MCNSCIFVVRALYDSIYWASFLTIPAKYAFCHINVISSCSSWSIRSRLAFDCNSSCWACCSTQFTCYASLLSCCISPQGMFSSEFRRERTLFIRIVHSPFRLENVQESTIEKRIKVLGHNNLKLMYVSTFIYMESNTSAKSYSGRELSLYE